MSLITLTDLSTENQLCMLEDQFSRNGRVLFNAGIPYQGTIAYSFSWYQEGKIPCSFWVVDYWLKKLDVPLEELLTSEQERRRIITKEYLKKSNQIDED